METKTGHDCDFIGGPPKELHWQCSICLLTLRQPYVVDCCGHHFCKACLDGATEVNVIGRTRCPLCKQEFTSMPNKGLERELNQRKVYCTHKKSGCEWTGELRELDSHLNDRSASAKSAPQCILRSDSNDQPPASCDTTDSLLSEGCQFVKLHCCNPYCPAMVLRSQMKAHLDSCPNKPICCKYCKNFTASPVCPKVPISCPNECGAECGAECAECGAEIRREDVDNHTKAACPLNKIPCKYRHEGCSYVSLRKEMESHMKSESGMATHLSLVEKALKRSKSRTEMLSQQVKRLEQEKAYHIREVRRLNENLCSKQAKSSEDSGIGLGTAAGLGLLGFGLGMLGTAGAVALLSASDDENTLFFILSYCH